MSAPVGPLGKECTRCGEYKTLTEFSPKKNGRLGRHNLCKPCTNQATKERRDKARAADPEGFRERQREIVRKSREKRGMARERLYSRAKQRAIQRLIDAHRKQFEAYLTLELDAEEREQAS